MDIKDKLARALKLQHRNILTSGRKLRELPLEFVNGDGEMVKASSPRFSMNVAESVHLALVKELKALSGSGTYIEVAGLNVIATSPSKEGQYGLMKASVIMAEKLLDVELVEFDEEF